MTFQFKLENLNECEKLNINNTPTDTHADASTKAHCERRAGI